MKGRDEFEKPAINQMHIDKETVIKVNYISGEDAKMAVAAGASAIYVSNHGGRELDGSLPT
ncbi:hypothetical protein NPIL_27311, partial [Nephila pilipes]